MTDKQILEFLAVECQIKDVMMSQKYLNPALDEYDLETDFNDYNVSILVKYFKFNLARKRGPQDIAEIEGEEEEEGN